MALMKCKECGNQVSTKAKACPTCGAKPRKTVGTLTGLIVIGLAIFIFSKMFADGGIPRTPSAPKEVVKSDPCDDTTMAFVMSQDFVKRQLKSPSTADFPYVNSDGVFVSKLPGCKFEVSAYVDSQNGFGAQIRTRYVAILESLEGGKSWRSHGVKFQ